MRCFAGFAALNPGAITFIQTQGTVESLFQVARDENALKIIPISIFFFPWGNSR